MKEIIKAIAFFILKAIVIILIILGFCFLVAWTMLLLEINSEDMPKVITALGFILTLMNLWDKFNPPTKDKTLENNSEKIISLLEDIKQNNVSTKNVAKKVKVRKIHKK